MAATFNFQALDITSETHKEYSFDLIPGVPSIMLAPMHDQNKEYQAERLRLSVERADRLVKQSRRKPVAPTAESIIADDVQDREDDKVLMARTVAKAWGKTPTATDGTQPDFSEENCLAFLRALPDFMFDGCRNFAKNLNNFVADVPLSDEDAEHAGN